MPSLESRPQVQPEIEPQSEYSVTMIGHSTLLIRMGDMQILTDPVWADQLFLIAPFGLGKRLTSPGLKIEDLPPIDFTTLSHGHFDHFDPITLQRLVQRGTATAVCHRPLVKRLENIGFTHIRHIEADETTQVGETTITAVHAEHRGKNTAIGFVFKHNNKTVYFAGDTGYSGIKEIADKYQPDIALLPIGEYPPPALTLAKWLISKGIQVPSSIMEWLEKYEKYKREKVHMSPEDVVKLSGYFPKIVVMHHGTYFLGGHIDPNEPADLMRQLIEESQLEDKITILAPGESLPF